ncbi:unnamed protein product [Ceratitis capitata]|uniref:(Mediterranean fruit fly) hypothetical protein n=1 Tax=Ceratitis capitata TaxID=7213 RepID=A0A811U043_CERCA|nr:unnamed protein product [Ceratitis capitata]
MYAFLYYLRHNNNNNFIPLIVVLHTEKAMAQVYKELDDTSPTGRDERSSESPSDPLPIYQQRDNYFS